MHLAFKGEISGVMSKTVQWDQTWDQAEPTPSYGQTKTAVKTLPSRTYHCEW